MGVELPDDYFRNMAQTAGLGVMATDEQFVIRFCNEAAARLLGKEPADLMGQPFSTIVPQDRVDLAHRVLQRLRDELQPSHIEFRYLRPDGQSTHLAITTSPVTQEGGLMGASVFLTDISRHVGLLRDMAQAQKMAALESVAGAVAHHFNNILGGAITTADFALASEDPDLHKRTLGITITALSRANELTLGLLAFAEGEHTDTVQVDIHDALARYIERLEPTLRAHNIRLDADLGQVRMLVPPKGLTQMLDRLTSNAVEAMPSGGTLTLELQGGENNEAVLRIGDTGPGIPERYATRVFEPFFTTKQPERNRVGQHPGLGLSVVYGIVKDLGGSIGVANAPRGGTVFTIRLTPRT